MEWLFNDALPLVARVCLVVLFPFSGLDKIVNWDSALEQANSSFLPGGPTLLVLAMTIEFVTPVCIVFGWYDGWAALVLAGYCVITAILYHNFWTYPRFWSSTSEGYPHVWDFLKNFGLVGGLLLIVLGSDLVPEVEAVAQGIPVPRYVHIQDD
jgi:putative oxidoreductase